MPDAEGTQLQGGRGLESPKAVAQVEPPGARCRPQRGVTIDPNKAACSGGVGGRSGWNDGSMVLETASLDPHSTPMFTNSASLVIALPGSEPQYLHPQNGDNHTGFIGLCGT